MIQVAPITIETVQPKSIVEEKIISFHQSALVIRSLQTDVICIDGRHCMSDEIRAIMRSAGIGALNASPDEAASVLFSDLNKLATERGSSQFNLRAHPDCGAAALRAAVILGLKNLPVEESDKIGQEFVYETAKILSVEFESPAEVSARPITNMQRPLGYHPEIGLTYSQAGVNPQLHGLFANNFGISRSIEANDTQVYRAIQELILAAKIGFGNHGREKMITEKHPFIFNILGTAKQLLQMQKEVLTAISSLEASVPEVSKRVKICLYKLI